MKIDFKRKDNQLLIRLTDSKDRIGYSEYTYHEQLDYPVIESVLSDLYNNNEHFLRINAINDKNEFQSLLDTDLPSVKNHSLYYKEIEYKLSSNVKIKLSGKIEKDIETLSILNSHYDKLRIDCNEKYTNKNIDKLLENINCEDIDYIEDIKGELTQTQINQYNPVVDQPFYRENHIQKNLNIIYRSVLKPNLDIDNNTIFSNQFGSILDSFQNYCYLLKKGNLKLEHGVFNPKTPQLYDYKDNKIKLKTSIIKDYYLKLEGLEWTSLIN